MSDELDLDEWYTREQAAEELGWSVRKIDRLIKAGTLPSTKKNRQVYIKPSDLEKVSGIAAIKSEGSLSDKADLLSVSSDLLRQSHAHNERLIDMLVKPLETLTSAYSKHIEQMAKRCEALEAKVSAMTEQHEQILNEQHNREVELLQIDASNQRKSQMMGMLKEQAPKILDALVAKNSKSLAAAKLLQSLDPTIVAGITEGDFLTSEQKKLLDDILTPEQKQAAKSVVS